MKYLEFCVKLVTTFKFHQDHSNLFLRENFIVWAGYKQVVIIKDDTASLIETTTHHGEVDFTKAFETIDNLISK